MKKVGNNPFDRPTIKVPFFSPWITREDEIAVMKALRSTMLTDGPRLREFEQSFAKFTGAKYAIGVSNATSALHLSLEAAGIKKDDEVIVPDMTFVATANAVIHAGAKPVFADIDMDDMNISVDSIIENITSKTKAILPVHFAGRVCKIEEIMKVARKNDLVVIEDCAHAIGAKYRDKHVGIFGQAGCFSFYPTKNITTIEGGMVITNSNEIAEKIKLSRNHGITKSLSERYSRGKPWDYDMFQSGYNYRLDEIRSSLGLSQLKRIRKLNSLRKKAYEYYTNKLSKIKGIITPPSSKGEENVFHLYIIKIEKEYGITRDELFEKLLDNGIISSVHYKPLHNFTAFQKFKRHNELKNSSKCYSEMLTLPFYPNITRKEQDLVIRHIQEIRTN